MVWGLMDDNVLGMFLSWWISFPTWGGLEAEKKTIGNRAYGWVECCVCQVSFS